MVREQSCDVRQVTLAFLTILAFVAMLSVAGRVERPVRSTPSMADAETQLRRVREHIEELLRAGRTADAAAVRFVRDLAEQVLAEQWPRRPRELLTTGQAGLALGISDQTVRNWVAAGRLPAVKRGVRTMIPRQV